MWYTQSISNRDERLLDITDTSFKRFLISIMLSIFPGLGQVYAGYFTRGVVGLLGLILLSWLCAILFVKTDSRLISISIMFAPFIYAFALCVDAALCAIKQNKIPSETKRKLQSIKIIGFILLFIGSNVVMDNMVGKHVVRAFIVSTNSMMPAILKHDLIIIDKLSKPEKNDVVLLDFNKGKNQTSISTVITDKTLRRVIATEGDIVEIRGRETFINSKQLEEHYAVFGKFDSHNIYLSSKYQWGPETVPKDTYFVMSDSRQFGFDSRSLGFINKNIVRGIAAKILWSWNLDEGFFDFGRTAIKIQ